MVVSIPISHPDAPAREGFIRGQYESVELIREIPLPRASNKSASTSDLLSTAANTDRKDASPSPNRTRGSTIANPGNPSFSIDKDEEDTESNPVEWIMITRSDPGGGIPRFMVERGTPGSIAADAVKFLNWACAKDEEELEEPDEKAAAIGEMQKGESEEGGAEVQDDKGVGGLAPPGMERRSFESARLSVVDTNAYLAGVGQSIADKPRPAGFDRRASSRSVRRYSRQDQDQDNTGESGGVLSSLSNAVESGINNYAPSSIRNSLLPQDRQEDDDDDSSTTETSSLDSFASAEQFKTAEEGPSSSDIQLPGGLPTSSESLSLSQQSLDAATASETSSQQQIPTPTGTEAEQHIKQAQKQHARYERELAKLATQKSKLTSQHQKNLESATHRHEQDADKRSRALARQQTKFDKEIQKLEQKREKETKKLLERQQKEANKNALDKLKREKDDLAKRVQILERENELLGKQVGELQRENTALVARWGKEEGGRRGIMRVRSELGEVGKGRERGSSVGSFGSGKSMGSGKDKEKEKEKESVKSLKSDKSEASQSEKAEKGS
jgi:hypothetical protein